MRLSAAAAGGCMLAPAPSVFFSSLSGAGKLTYSKVLGWASFENCHRSFQV